jgi:hypothetical protein
MSVLLLAACLSAVLAAVPEDEIKALPGWDGPLSSKQYSGYLAVGKAHMHYYLVLSEKDPTTSATVLWLNGGPGCSSLDGLVYEHGPWRINDTDTSKLYRNPDAWARQANVVYLESPAGVGFSYSNDPSDYRTNDDKTALLNAATMKVFFQSYPELVKNDFFITGESYGGIYVPTLAEAIMWEEGNKTWTGAHLTGMAAGNGCTGTEIGVCGGERDKYMTQYLLGQGFTKRNLKDNITLECDFSKPVTAKCRGLLLQMSEAVGHVDMYNVYGPCISGSEEALYGASHSKIGVSSRWEYGGPDACINSISASAYLNKPEVIDALHVVAQKFPWSVCGNQIDYTPTRPNLPRDTYPALIGNMRVLIFNGDWDACVPYTDNEAWTEAMGLKVADDWHPWSYGGGQVGGYATRYFGPNNFTFITIKGGRHEVPETAPLQSSEMLRRLLAHENF